VDPNQQPVPIGVAGEILIGGTAWRAAICTSGTHAEKFIPNPSAPMPARVCTALAISDVTGRTATSNFLAASIIQVKVRGYRIELSAIEAALRRPSGHQGGGADGAAGHAGRAVAVSRMSCRPGVPAE